MTSLRTPLSSSWQGNMYAFQPLSMLPFPTNESTWLTLQSVTYSSNPIGHRLHHTRTRWRWPQVPSSQLTFCITPKRNNMTILGQYSCVGGSQWNISNFVTNSLYSGQCQCSLNFTLHRSNVNERYEILIAGEVSWDVTLCHWVSGSWCYWTDYTWRWRQYDSLKC
jgi:hypothetical protein